MTRVILVAGKLQSGKNEFAKELTKCLKSKGLTVAQDSFAFDLKKDTYKDFAEMVKYLNSLNIPELKLEKENFQENKTKLSRILLQTYGTNIMRNRVDTDIWVNKLKSRLEKSTKDYVIITDVRFPNEIDNLSTTLDTVAIKIDRKLDRTDSVNSHGSETSLDRFKSFNFIVDNNDSKKQLTFASQSVCNELTKEQIPREYVF